MIYVKEKLIELGSKLKNMCDNALNGEAKTMIHIFGIKYANDIRRNGFAARYIKKRLV